MNKQTQTKKTHPLLKVLLFPFQILIKGVGRFFGVSKDNLEKIKIWVEVFAIVGAACLAVWKFVYQDFLVPRSYKPSVKVTCQLTEIASTDSTVAVRLNYKIKNDSKRRKFILVTRYQITGQSYSNGRIFDQKKNDFKKMETGLETFNAMEVRHVGQHYNLEYALTRYEGIACGTFQTNSRLEEDTDVEGGIDIIVSNRYDIIGVELDVSYSDSELPDNNELRLFVTDACKFIGYLNEKQTQKIPKVMFEESVVLQEKYNLAGTSTFDDLYIKKK